MMHPVRRGDVLIQDLGEEMVVYDREGETVHRLDRTAALVYRHADGHTSVAALGAIVERELETGEGKAVAALALDALREAGLLEERGMSAMQKGLLAGAGLALLVPVVETLRAPTAAAAFSF